MFRYFISSFYDRLIRYISIFLNSVATNIFLLPLIGVATGIYLRFHVNNTIRSFEVFIICIFFIILYFYLKKQYFILSARFLFTLHLSYLTPSLLVESFLALMLICFLSCWICVGYLTMSFRIDRINDIEQENRRSMSMVEQSEIAIIEGKLSKIDIRGNKIRFYLDNPNLRFIYYKVPIIPKSQSYPSRKSYSPYRFNNASKNINIIKYAKSDIRPPIQLSGYARINMQFSLSDKKSIALKYPIGALFKAKIALLKQEGAKQSEGNVKKHKAATAMIDREKLHIHTNEHIHMDDYNIERFMNINLQELYFFKRIVVRGHIISKPITRLSTKRNFFHLLEQARINLSAKIHQAISKQPEIAGLMIAFLLGDTSFIEESIYRSFRNCGALHLIAISGMHIAALFTIVFLIAKKLCSFFPYILEFLPAQKIASFVSIFAIFFYFLFSGMSISALRAVICGVIAAFCLLQDAHLNFLRILNICALIILLVSPEELFSPSLQLSLMSCCGIVCGLRTQTSMQRFFNLSHIKKNLAQSLVEYKQRRFGIQQNKLKIEILAYLGNLPLIVKYLVIVSGFYISSLVIVSSIIALFTFGITIAHFHAYAIYTIPVNLLLIPLCDLFVMPLSLLAMIEILLSANYTHNIFLPLAKHGIISMVSIADLFSNIDNAYLQLVNSSNITQVLLISLPMLCTFTQSKKVRFSSLALIAICILWDICHRQSRIIPDIIIIPKINLIGINTRMFSKAAKETLIFNKNTDNFHVKILRDFFFLPSPNDLYSGQNTVPKSAYMNKMNKNLCELMKCLKRKSQNCVLSIDINSIGINSVDINKSINLPSHLKKIRKNESNAKNIVNINREIIHQEIYVKNPNNKFHILFLKNYSKAKCQISGYSNDKQNKYEKIFKSRSQCYSDNNSSNDSSDHILQEQTFQQQEDENAKFRIDFIIDMSSNFSGDDDNKRKLGNSNVFNKKNYNKIQKSSVFFLYYHNNLLNVDKVLLTKLVDDLLHY